MTGMIRDFSAYEVFAQHRYRVSSIHFHSPSQRAAPRANLLPLEHIRHSNDWTHRVKNSLRIPSDNAAIEDPIC
jgi:hypothetical protein